MRLTRHLHGAARLSLCLLSSYACGGQPDTPPTAAPGPAAATATTDTRRSDATPPAPPPCSQLRLRPDVARGVSFVHSYQHGGARGYGSSHAATSLERLENIGVGAISIMPFGFMSALDDTSVRLVGEMRAGETDARVIAQVRMARKLGMTILLKPHIWVSGGGWRGEINFDDEAQWDQWFSSHRDFVLHYARLAEAESVEELSIGVELRSTTTRFAARWRALIADVRAVYRGKLTYSANWDEAPGVQFWDALDYIGVQFFPSIADAPGASEAAMRTAADRHLDILATLSKRFERPVVLTEVGYKAVASAGVKPYLWPERLSESERSPDPQAQVRAYRAMLSAVRERSWLHGLYIWKWFSDLDTTEEKANGYSPHGKPSSEVLRCAFSRAGG